MFDSAIPGTEMLGQPRMGSIYDELGTPESGYSEDGPFHCSDCVHKIKFDEPFCTHPKVIGDSELQERLVQIDGRPVVKINMERGCCRYVRPNHPNDDATGAF
jgi:hypothetical protein